MVPTALAAEPVADLMAALSAARGPARLLAGKALRHRSEQSPEAVYPYFDSLVELLYKDNRILQWNALLTLANLARVDGKAKIDGILDRYLEVIHGPVMISAANAIRGAATIGAARPDLLPRIVTGILSVERATYATPECRNVAIGHALDAFSRLAPLLENPRRIRLFAQRQVNNPRRSTGARAEKLLTKLRANPSMSA